MPKKKRHVVVMIDLTWPLPHHHHVFSGIHRYAREHSNWNVTIDPHVDRLFSDRQRGPKPDGVIGRATPMLAKGSVKANVPVVNIWQNSPAKDLPTVSADYEEAGRMAAKHLIVRGYRRFAFLGISRDLGSRLQQAGFVAAVNDAGYDCSVCSVSRFQSSDRAKWHHFQEQLGEWIDSWKPPVAVGTHTDLLARYVAEACHGRQMKVPADVALIGSQNEPLICLNPEPLLSSIDLGFERIGYQAAHLLNKMMNGAAAPKEPIRFAPAELILRQSSNAFATHDLLVTSALVYIADRTDKTISVDEVANAVSTTRRTLARRFRKSLGQSIHETIMYLRIDHIKRELLETDDTLKTISHRCGLRDAIQLCRMFQREAGISPTEFRKLRKPNHLDEQQLVGPQ